MDFIRRCLRSKKIGVIQQANPSGDSHQPISVITPPPVVAFTREQIMVAPFLEYEQRAPPPKDNFHSMEDDSNSVIAPHRGFKKKAREILLDKNEFRVMPKSSSEFDIRKKLNSFASRKKDSNGSTPPSQNSVSSIPEHPTFDTIGERPNVKKHMKLGDVGKTRSCVELKTNDKRLLRTFQEDNIIKMPSMDSDICTDMDTGVADLCLSFEGLGKSLIYSQSDDNNSNDVKGKKANKK